MHPPSRPRLAPAVELCHDFAMEPSSAAPIELFRKMLDISPNFICAFLPDTTFTYVNDAYTRFFKTSREALVGRKFIELTPPSARAEVFARLGQPTPDHPHVTYEHEFLNPDGGLNWFRWVDHAIFDADGRIDCFVSIGEEITG